MGDLPKKKAQEYLVRKRIRIGSIIATVCVVAVIGFFASYNLRVWLAGTLLTTQHRHWAKYTLIGSDKLNALMSEIDNPKVSNSSPLPIAPIPVKAPVRPVEQEPLEVKEEIPAPPQELNVSVEKIEKNISATHYFKGHVMVVNDPNRVHLVPTVVKKGRNGKPRGEWIDEFSERTKAIGGLNASGFSDPGGKSWATSPMGLIIIDGKLIQDYSPTGGITALGITYNGKLITGAYKSQELLDLGVRDAVSFKPQLVVNGESLFPEETAAWGFQPRSAVGQRDDGAIVFIQVDGRSSTSIGASMKDMADLMLEQGVVNAMAMDGGTSAFMIHQGDILTDSPVSDPRGRFLPNAWMVY